MYLVHSTVVHRSPVPSGLDESKLALAGLVLNEEYVWGEERVEHYLKEPTEA